MIHCVYFWLKKDLSETDRQTFQDELTRLTKLDYLASAQMGKPAPVPARPVCDLSFDWSCIVHFKELKDHDYYQDGCPDHKRFVDTCKTMWDKVIIYDMTPQ
jgi:Stress responsive A/B Barrel Domain